jgi:aryl-alcohol dehydrogenase-like predicted oxidoreductase
MKYRLLGKSGLQISEAALGTMTFGDEWGWGSLKDEAQRVYETYREAGGNFIDTANSYTGGTSETFVGEFIKGHRESVVLVTKYFNQRTVRKLALKENLGGCVERKADELKE